MKYNICPVQTLQITFDLSICPRQIKNWRGAFIEMAGLRDDLFHNHQGAKGYHYRYPLIQYRMDDKQASIFAIGDGVAALKNTLSENEWCIRWQGKERELDTKDVSENKHILKMTNHLKSYQLFNYLPFNKENYQQWKNCKNYIQRIQLMQKILTGHLLGFSEAMGYHLPERLKVDIQYVQLMQKVNMHGTEVLAFNITYTCNMELPDGIGLGRSVSHGFGWQKKVVNNHRKAPAAVVVQSCERTGIA